MMSWQTPLKRKVVLFIRIVAGWDQAAYEKRKGDRTSQDREFRRVALINFFLKL